MGGGGGGGGGGAGSGGERLGATTGLLAGLTEGLVLLPTGLNAGLPVVPDAALGLAATLAVLFAPTAHEVTGLAFASRARPRLPLTSALLAGRNVQSTHMDTSINAVPISLFICSSLAQLSSFGLRAARTRCCKPLCMPLQADMKTHFLHYLHPVRLHRG